MFKKSLPFEDINGNTIYDGDTIEDIQGQRGVVRHDIKVRDPDYRWSIDFGRGNLIPIEQVGMVVMKINTSS